MVCYSDKGFNILGSNFFLFLEEKFKEKEACTYHPTYEKHKLTHQLLTLYQLHRNMKYPLVKSYANIYLKAGTNEDIGARNFDGRFNIFRSNFTYIVNVRKNKIHLFVCMKCGNP
jgi:hypothetical protein